ncbi:hypothetical protein, partial [Haloferula sargassicola]|uniref:hypothetical protein n=1 Tax=Haloferula sargassicola TaxID=490096 RepID=UPI0033658C01
LPRHFHGLADFIATLGNDYWLGFVISGLSPDQKRLASLGAQRQRPPTPALGRGLDCWLTVDESWQIELAAGQVLGAPTCSALSFLEAPESGIANELFRVFRKLLQNGLRNLGVVGEGISHRGIGIDGETRLDVWSDSTRHGDLSANDNPGIARNRLKDLDRSCLVPRNPLIRQRIPSDDLSPDFDWRFVISEAVIVVWIFAPHQREKLLSGAYHLFAD